MPTLKVTREVRDMIRAASNSPLGFRDTGHDTPDGEYEFPVEQETYDRVMEKRLPGESISDCLQRVLLTQHGAN